MEYCGHLQDEYQELVTRLNAGLVGMPEPTDEEARHGSQEILEILDAPEEAALAARMPIAPASLATIARRVGGEPETLRRQLDAMAHETALPTDILPEVLASERATAAVENADLIGVQYCYCRHLAALERLWTDDAVIQVPGEAPLRGDGDSMQSHERRHTC